MMAAVAGSFRREEILMNAHPVDATAFSVFEMQPVTADDLDSVLASADDALAVVFFWGEDCFNCEAAKKVMLAQSEAVRALGLR